MQNVTLICSNPWISEINNHSNQLNGQVLLSFNFSCYDSHSCYQRLPIQHYIAGNLQSWLRGECHCLLVTSHSISALWVRKCQSKQLYSLVRWTTSVLLLSMLHITMAMVNLVVDQIHDSQLVTISSMAAKDGKRKHSSESPQRKQGEITTCSISLFGSCSTTCEMCKFVWTRKGLIQLRLVFP